MSQNDKQQGDKWHRLIYICERNAQEWRDMGGPTNAEEGAQWQEMGDQLRELSAPSAIAPTTADRAKLLNEWNALVFMLGETFGDNTRSMQKVREVHELIVKMAVSDGGGA